MIVTNPTVLGTVCMDPKQQRRTKIAKWRSRKKKLGSDATTFQSSQGSGQVIKSTLLMHARVWDLYEVYLTKTICQAEIWSETSLISCYPSFNLPDKYAHLQTSWGSTACQFNSVIPQSQFCEVKEQDRQSLKSWRLAEYFRCILSRPCGWSVLTRAVCIEMNGWHSWQIA